MRGYDRGQVDRYINRVNQVLAEFQIAAAPEAAIKRALDELAREKESVIEEAHRAAEEITQRSRSRADERIEEATQETERVRAAADEEARETHEAAERDARAIRAAAEARVRELEDQVEGLIERRDGVIEELRALAGSLDQVVEGEGHANGRASREDSPAAKTQTPAGL